MQTVFVVGAGASAEFGFPVGRGLQGQIRNRVDPKLLPNQESAELEAIADELSDRGLSYQQQWQHFEWFGRTLPLAGSIDSFLEDQSAPNDATAFLGKFMIARIIGEAEKQSPLYLTRKKRVDFDVLADTWLGKLWSKMNSGGGARISEKGLRDVAFVTFNYDRCIEQFLYLAFRDYYRVSRDSAISFVQNVKIHHVYGSLGDAFDAEGLPFGEGSHPHHFIRSASKIRTYSEELESGQIRELRKILQSAERLVFLGFSYAPINQCVLSQIERNQRLMKVHGTSFQMSSADTKRAAQWCDRTFRRGEPGSQLQNLQAAKFFDENALLFGAP